MNRRFVQAMLSIASLAVVAYSQNTASLATDLLPDEDGGQARVDLDAGIAPIEKLAWLHVVITIGGAVDRQTKRLNHVGADQIG